jgi:hypothetical protein
LQIQFTKFNIYTTQGRDFPWAQSFPALLSCCSSLSLFSLASNAFTCGPGFGFSFG